MDSVHFSCPRMKKMCFDCFWRLSCARPRQKLRFFFVSRFTEKKDGDEWLGTVKDKINIYRLKIVKKSEKFISRFFTIGFALNSAQKGY